MSDERNSANKERWGRREWGMVALLAYLWSWLVLWSLSRAGFLPSNEALGRICLVVYWPLIQLGLLLSWIRSHM